MILRTSLSFAACLTVLAGAAEPTSQEKPAVVFEDSLLKTLIRNGPTSLTLQVDWQETGALVLIRPATDSRTESVYRTGATTIKRTMLATPDAILLHFIADQPGALTFRVTLSIPPPSTVDIKDRRQLIAKSAELNAHIWVLPYESEVVPENGSITVRGEGEALILLNFSEQKDSEKRLSQTLSELGNKYDPGHIPPDPSKIWQGAVKAMSAPTAAFP